MNLPTITPERAKELRALIEWFCREGIETPEEKAILTALRNYATLIDTVLDGGDVVTDDLVQHVRNHACAIPKHGVYKVEDFIVGDVDSVVYAALTAALPAIRLRLLADTAKEEGIHRGG